MRPTVPLAGLVLCALVLAACTDSNEKPRAAAWPKSYAETTCPEYNSAMTEEQQRAAAADMLADAQKLDGSTQSPMDRKVNGFVVSLAMTCALHPNLDLATVGVTLYRRDKNYKPEPLPPAPTLSP
ncbi:hypothetical protein ABT160_41420 [Streptomyces sp. NPDC001941]|uniref:hypothetical protein n=1 Tax=Streptomyces sp. NPDC001941 TaxID=3154659 RepID=UPI00332E449C